MIAFFFIVVGLFAFLLIVGSISGRDTQDVIPKTESDKSLVSVLIPFRNEEHNLPQLIDSIRNQLTLPHEILLLDDHSTDNGKQLLEAAFFDDKHIMIHSLPTNVEGKKAAIAAGVSLASGDYCLTLDADVRFSSCFFKDLVDLPKSDMLIRPVVMTSSTFLSGLFAFEYMMFNAFNFTFAPFYVNSASGANLLFSREKYVKFTSLREHQSLASGDDHFLLRDFQKNNAKIALSNQLNSAVYSSSCLSWKDYFNQRIRWLSKTKVKSNWKELFIGALLTFYLIGSFVLAIFLLSEKNGIQFFGVLSVRFLLDLFVFSNFTARLGVVKLFLFYPIFLAFYPILFITVLFGSLFYRPKWKGRALLKK